MSKKIKQINFQELLERYFSTYITKKRNILIDAIHAAQPTSFEIYKILKKEREKDRKLKRIFLQEIKSFIRCTKRKVALIKKANPRLTFKGAVLSLKKQENDYTKQRILTFINKFDENSGEIAGLAAQLSQSSLLIAKKSRLTVDANRHHKFIKHLNKRQARKRSENINLAIKQVIIQSQIRRTKKTEKSELLTQPFLHISVHSARNHPQNKGDFIIANGLIKRKMPCHPTVARWFCQRVNEKIREHNLKKNGKLFSAGIAIEGERLSGASINVARRFGSKKTKKLGHLYQHIQLEITRSVRVQYPAEIMGKIIGEIVNDFTKIFLSRQKYEKYIKTHKTAIDNYRLAGKIHTKKIKYSQIIPENEIAISWLYRNAFGVKINDIVKINHENFFVRKGFQKNPEVLFLHSSRKVKIPAIIEKYT
ncbi:MAG: Uncharacterized protein CEN89_509 [Candidatus Berkelbacteria bacterium Licking1014_7]|uniref:Uncharacterized protein n=1 Tax=Candidatus Berkelbacteria bacterium Licking1014_7 TaxID=2017147 RepID=A0A554LIL9_9BACT|nr:MAG: Uncharacterized protein CEN89_509 [Candidatus Berkelbacteria bacterium Licking1014_7]